MDKISPSQWGPHLWNIIHTASLRIGYGGRGEARLFTSLVSILPGALPCHACQKHAGEYLRRADIVQRVGRWQSLQGDALRAEIVHFFWEFHNHVNMVAKETPTKFYELESLMTKYSADEMRRGIKGDLTSFLRALSTAAYYKIVAPGNSSRMKATVEKMVQLILHG